MFTLVIPTLNEEELLPKLLESVKKQYLRPSEIIVADADSNDKTRGIAKSYGCKIVNGGRIAVGRNNGVRAASKEIVVMLDADSVIPNREFFNKTIGKFISKNADVASCFFLPSEKKIKYELPMVGVNAVKYISHKLKLNKVIGGACIVTTKSAFKELKGFDEKIKAHEDNDYFDRAVKAGMKFIIIRESIRTSTRRIERKGVRRILLMGILGIAAGVIGGSWIKKKQRNLDKKFWDDVI